MAVERLAISFDPELAKEVRAASDDNVSAWLADAARLKLRQEALARAVEQFEEEHGEITEAELRKARKKWPASR